uniref:BED-type domain-containing protein n=1 Tax=Amphimedon queenslandica TaxID=400682 RepID=A0A1X7VFF3_AMPQE
MRMDIIEESSSIASLPISLPSTSSSESDSSSLTDEEDIKARVKYNLFLEFLRCKEGQNPSAKCKLCHHTYKFTLTSKGNLLKHLQTTHPDKLRDHKEEQAKLISVTEQKFNKDGTFIPRTKEPFRNQDKILTSIVRNLCGKGGLAISVVEQSWFCSFMQEVEPKFQPVSRVALNSKLDRIFEEEKKGLLADIAKSVVDKPSVTVDLWTDNLGLICFTIITDNAANMRCAFEMENQEVESRNVADTNLDDIGNDELDLLTLWTPCE